MENYNEPLTLKKLEKVLNSICEDQKKKDPYQILFGNLAYHFQVKIDEALRKMVNEEKPIIIGKRRNPEVNIHKARLAGYSLRNILDVEQSITNKDWLEKEIKPIDLKMTETEEYFRKHIYVDFAPIIQPDFRKQNIIPIHKNK